MTLTVGDGPFGHHPAGRFNQDLPQEGVAYVEPFARRIRAVLGGDVVADSTRGRLLHEHGRLPRYFFPREDVRGDAADRFGQGSEWEELDGFVHLEWKAMEKWLHEEEEVVGHIRDPYHRVEVLESSRHVIVSKDGELLAESRRPIVAFETSLPPRWYLAREDVVAEVDPSDLATTCAYKGHASYWTVGGHENIAWSYERPLHDAARLRGRICFFNEQVDLEFDGERAARPATQWSSARWWEGR